MGQSRIPRAAGLLVVAVACLVLPGAGGDTDTAEHCSYPASQLVLIEGGSEQWQDVVPMLRARLQADSARADSWRSPSGSRALPNFHVPSGPRSIDSTIWYRVEPHGAFRQALPGVDLYLGDGGVSGYSRDWIERLMAVRNSTVYRMPWELNQLLRDAGVLLDSTRVHEWARIAALLWCGENRRLLVGYFRLELDAPSGFQPYFPPVTFLRTEMDTNVTYFGRGRVLMRVWGREAELVLETRPECLADGRWIVKPYRVLGPDGIQHYETTFDPW